MSKNGERIKDLFQPNTQLESTVIEPLQVLMADSRCQTIIEGWFNVVNEHHPLCLFCDHEWKDARLAQRAPERGGVAAFFVVFGDHSRNGMVTAICNSCRSDDMHQRARIKLHEELGVEMTPISSQTGTA